MTIRSLNGLYAAIAVAMLAGCTSSNGRAPISELGVGEPREAASATQNVASGKQVHGSLRQPGDWRPMTYVVQKGDTLYSIAFNYGQDYHDIAELNNIQDPNVIRVGQELRLFSGEAPAGQAVAKAPVVEESQPSAAAIPVKDQPKVAKLAYSDKALAQMQKAQAAPAKPETPAPAKVEAKPVPEAKPAAKPEAASVAAEGELDWGMPADGKVVAGFSESANRKGIDIAGKLGQPVKASAAGKVVYSGSGLRGYGKLVIIKHNSTYLSAYAHNSNILVKEGETVSKGQKIAEMGNTDASQIELHFEIRKLGQPVDPAKYLSLK